jgi:hypothetical protein
VEKTLSEYDKFHGKLRSDMITWRTEQELELKNKTINPESSSSQNDRSQNDTLSSQKKKKKLLLRPRELWEVSEFSMTADLDILARLFRVEAYKFSAKPAKMSWIPCDKLNFA